MRRTLLFLPGNNPGNLQSGTVFGADGIILDLEDSVSPAEKDAARLLVASALTSVDYAGVERAVRINTFAARGAAPSANSTATVTTPCTFDFFRASIDRLSSFTSTSALPFTPSARAISRRKSDSFFGRRASRETGTLEA